MQHSAWMHESCDCLYTVCFYLYIFQGELYAG